MPDYSLGKIYKVTCSQTNRIYIGSTTQKLDRRLARHKNKKYNQCITNDFIDPTIELIKSFPCETRNELLWEERRVQEENECINYRKPITTKEEHKEVRNHWSDANREHIRKRERKYYDANRERINMKRKTTRDANKEKINATKREWYNANKEELSAKRKKKYHANKDEINAKRREKDKQKKQNSL